MYFYRRKKNKPKNHTYFRDWKGITLWKATAHFLIKKLDSMLAAQLSLVKGMKEQRWQHMTDYSSWMSGTTETGTSHHTIHFIWFTLMRARQKEEKRKRLSFNMSKNTVKLRYSHLWPYTYLCIIFCLNSVTKFHSRLFKKMERQAFVYSKGSKTTCYSAMHKTYCVAKGHR